MRAYKDKFEHEVGVGEGSKANTEEYRVLSLTKASHGRLVSPAAEASTATD
jgi:hypothetical protein